MTEKKTYHEHMKHQNTQSGDLNIRYQENITRDKKEYLTIKNGSTDQEAMTVRNIHIPKKASQYIKQKLTESKEKTDNLNHT